MNAKDPYRILQVARHAEQEVIEAAYRRLARKYHPDVNRDPETSAEGDAPNGGAAEPQSKEPGRPDWSSGQEPRSESENQGLEPPVLKTLIFASVLLALYYAWSFIFTASWGSTPSGFLWALAGLALGASLFVSVAA